MSGLDWLAFAIVLPTQPVAPQLGSLCDGLHKSYKDVQIKADFTIDYGFCNSVDEGLRLGVNESITNPESGVYMLAGVFMKRGELIRVSAKKIPGRKSKASGERNSAATSSIEAMDYDEVSNGKIQIRYRRDIDTCMIMRARPEWTAAGSSSSFIIGPFQPMGKGNWDPFRFIDFNNGRVIDPQVKTIKMMDMSHAEVALADEPNAKYTRRIRFRISEHQPLITEIEDKVELPSVGAKTRFVRLSDWRQCNGVQVASRVVSVMSNAGRIAKVEEWKSSNLGRALPGHDDFVVAVPQTTTVLGLRDRVPKSRDGQVIDIAKIQLSDLIE